MEKNFKRGEQCCGHYDQHQLPHGGPEEDRKRRSDDFDDRYDRDDPSVGIKQITTGFRKWAQRYIAACSGQRQYQYQVNRMNKWNSLLQAHLTGSAPDLPQIPILKEAISCEWSNQVKGVGSQNAYPTCADGEIEIISAKYGRWSQDVCYREDGEYMGVCNDSRDHTSAVSDKCNGKQSCVYHGKNTLAGDPCWGVTKYTVIKYKCV